MRGRVRLKRRALDKTNDCIVALNQLYRAPNPAGTLPWGVSSASRGPVTPRQLDVLSYLHACCLDFVDCDPPRADLSEDCLANGDYDDPRSGPIPLEPSKVSLPPTGGTFHIGKFLSPELAAYLHASPPSLVDPPPSELFRSVRSCHRVQDGSYPTLIARMFSAGMCDFSVGTDHRSLGLFGVWKVVGERMRLIVDARPANIWFRTPPYEFTTGDSLARIQVPPGFELEVAKADLADYFHACRTEAGVRSFFPLKPLSVESLRALGVHVPGSCTGSGGFTTPRLTTLPMGWGPSPAIAQAGHEAVLYGQVSGLPGVLDPVSRFSSQRTPAEGLSHFHALVIDDLLLFRLVEVPRRRFHPAECGFSPVATTKENVSAPALSKESLKDPAKKKLEKNSGVGGTDHSPAGLDTEGERVQTKEKGTYGRLTSVGSQDGGAEVSLAKVLQRYGDVDLPVKLEKVHDYARSQDILGHTLSQGTLRASGAKYTRIAAEVWALERRGFARPREVERITGRFTHIFLLHRLSLAVFSSVYAFARRLGHVAAPVWRSVLQEFRRALALVPIVRSDLSRPVSPVLLQTDASGDGSAVVYTKAVPLLALQRECRRPTARPATAGTSWRVETALAAEFDAPVDPALWKIALRGTFSERWARETHINVKELRTVVDGARWASRGQATRACRLVAQADSAVAVAAIRKGRSSAPAMLSECRRLAAITLADRIALEARWVPTTRNMADRPSRGGRQPGPCLPSVVRPRGAGQGGYAGVRVGEQSHPGPPPVVSVDFWSPLMDGNLSADTRENYAAEVRRFVVFVRDHGEAVGTAADLDYWLAYYAHDSYVSGMRGRGAVEKALYGVEHWFVEAKPLTLARRCLRGWRRLQPPRPAAPMTRDLCRALAVVAALGGTPAVGLAMLLSFDLWLRISEVSGLTPRDVVDTRGQADPVGRGVSVYLPVTKTGPRQAVAVQDPAVAALLLCWKAAVARTSGFDAPLFPRPAGLRQVLARGLRTLDDGDWSTRGLTFVWHSFRHGGASRAHLAGVPLSDILTRGRWAVESSGRHYIQAGRQLLLALSLPDEVAELASRFERAGLEALFDPDLDARLRQ